MPRRWVVASAGIAASVLLIAGVALLVTTPRTPTDTPVVTATVAAVPPAMREGARALNEVVASTSGGAVEATGEGIALVNTTTLTTTMAFVAGSTIQTTAADGRVLTATRVVTDPVTGVTVASFASPVTTTTVRPSPPVAGTELTALDIPQGVNRDERRWQTAHMESAATLEVIGSTTLGTMHDDSTIASTATSLLVAHDGAVVGISDPTLGNGTYLPADMVIELSRSLITTHTMRHGVLGITGGNDHGEGARVLSVETTGPSNGVLDRGDAITAVDTTRVTCAADLVDSIWARPAGDTVSLTLDRHGETEHESVTLAAGP